MKTLVMQASASAVDFASNLIRNGEIVAVPTETVYGIAGSAYDGNAIKKIFEAKGRPQDNPLIVHISSMDMLFEVASYVSDDAKKLAEAFWPGPLTIVVPKGDKVAKETCAGLDSVGVRMPSNQFAHDLIVKSGVPFAAPSANLSGKPSPTNAQAVIEDMDGRLPLIVDGGESFGGVESTVVSVLGKSPVLLRPGSVTKEDMEKVLGKEVLISSAILESVKEGESVLSPGMKYKHYAPKAEVIVVEGDFHSFEKFVNENATDKTYCLVFSGEEDKLSYPCVTLGAIDDDDSQAHNLFACLRRLDELGAKKVFARCPKKVGVALAVYNRLIRAAGFNIVTV